jgi:lipopolysaccharide export system protein LptC
VLRVPRPALLGALAVVAGVSWWLAGPAPVEEARPVAPPGHVPEYFATNLRSTTMDAQGRPARSLETPRLTRFLDDETSELESPVLRVFQDGEPPWVIRSERAWVSPDGETVTLLGKVKITRDAAPGIRPVEVDTTNLLVRRKDDYAETADFATLVSRNSRASGVGVQAWLGKENRIRLLSQARGHYEIDTEIDTPN